MLGLDPLPKRAPLKAQITGRLERDAYRIEKIVFQSLPGLYVTVNFYVLKGGAKPSPTDSLLVPFPKWQVSSRRDDLFR